MTKNPHVIGQAVQDPDMFFGRQKKLVRLRDRLRKGESTAVVGLRRMGKSSLLYQLAHQTEALPESVAAAYLDLHDPRCRTVPGLLTAALQELGARLGDRSRFGEAPTMEAFAEAVRQMRKDNLRPALCLDEMEKLMERDCFDRDFF